jgi:SAM-dependent methyltransferase
MECQPLQATDATARRVSDQANSERLADRWQRPGLGRLYRRSGAAGRRAHKDGAQCRRLLAPLAGTGWLLDAPSGSGRLFEQLSGLPLRYLGIDISAEMLSAHPRPERLVRARLEALPLADAAVDWAVCCRLLHHLPESEDWLVALRELRRVARRGVLFSFFDARSWPAWRARLRGRDRDRAGRRFRSRATVSAWCGAAGLTEPRFAAQSGWFSAQTFALCQPAADGTADGRACVAENGA